MRQKDGAFRMTFFRVLRFLDSLLCVATQSIKGLHSTKIQEKSNHNP
ncbi:hypothetical protein GF337_06460 [candidate division KSB1 bacterium]|nr:hypothetical protein [candidate division KSB1 bacterium]